MALATAFVKLRGAHLRKHRRIQASAEPCRGLGGRQGRRRHGERHGWRRLLRRQGQRAQLRPANEGPGPELVPPVTFGKSVLIWAPHVADLQSFHKDQNADHGPCGTRMAMLVLSKLGTLLAQLSSNAHTTCNVRVSTGRFAGAK